MKVGAVAGWAFLGVLALVTFCSPSHGAIGAHEVQADAGYRQGRGGSLGIQAYFPRAVIPNPPVFFGPGRDGIAAWTGPAAASGEAAEAGILAPIPIPASILLLGSGLLGLGLVGRRRRS